MRKYVRIIKIRSLGKGGDGMSGTLTANYQKVIYEKQDSPFACVLNCCRDTNDQLELAWHEEMEIKYIVSGSMHIHFGTKVEQVKQGDLVVINSCQYHTNQFEDGEKVVYHLLCVDLSRLGILRDSLAGEENSGVRFQNIIRNDPDITQYAELMFHGFDSQQDSMLHIGLFLAFFANLKRYTENRTGMLSGGKRPRGQEEMVHLAFSYIHEHYAQMIRVADIARQCYVTEAHFCRVFRAFTGMTPVTYINKLRLNKAIAMLEHTDLRFSEIAAQVGFVDSSYLCRNFKKYTGISPSAYCKKRSGETPEK